MANYDPIDEALNVKSEIIPTPEDVVSKKKNEIKKTEGQDVGKDYDYTRQTTLRYLEDLRNAELVEEWKYQDAERQALEDKVLKRGTYFNRKFDYCDVHEGSFQP